MIRPKPIKPGPGQESVWAYPRPPRLEKTSKKIEVIYNDVLIAESTNAYRVLETSHPPSYYIPPNDFNPKYFLHSKGHSSMCEWKGAAKYYTIEVNGRQAVNAAWYYPTPTSEFMPIKYHIAIYAQMMDACYVAGEKVIPQPGGFYGGWVTADVVGPFKGEAGSWGW